MKSLVWEVGPPAVAGGPTSPPTLFLLHCTALEAALTLSWCSSQHSLSLGFCNRCWISIFWNLGVLLAIGDVRTVLTVQNLHFTEDIDRFSGFGFKFGF